MGKELLNIANDKELRIISVELVDIINDFRKLESESTGKEYVKLRHDNFLTKIEKEVEVLNSLGLNAVLNFKEGKYLDKNNQFRPCYELNHDGMLQILNSESALVRYKTIEYINKLEDENNRLKENQRLISAQKEIQELKETIDESKAIIEDFKRVTDEAKDMYKPSHKRKLQYDRLIKTVTSNKEEYDIVKEWIFASLEIEKWEDTSIEQNKKILEIISTVSRMLNIKKFEQLRLF